MQVQTPLTSVYFLAGIIRACVTLLNVVCTSSVMAFSSIVEVAFALKLFKIIAIESLNLNDISKEIVSSN